jgi:hypothetical protein
MTLARQSPNISERNSTTSIARWYIVEKGYIQRYVSSKNLNLCKIVVFKLMYE